MKDIDDFKTVFSTKNKGEDKDDSSTLVRQQHKKDKQALELALELQEWLEKRGIYNVKPLVDMLQAASEARREYFK